jgi:hypothetical protein
MWNVNDNALRIQPSKKPYPIKKALLGGWGRHAHRVIMTWSIILGCGSMVNAAACGMAGPGSIPRFATNCTSDTKTTGSLTLCLSFCQEDPFLFAIEVTVQCKRWLIDDSVCRFYVSRDCGVSVTELTPRA